MDAFNVFTASLAKITSDAVAFLPHILGATLILFVGLVLARLVQRGVIKLLRLIRLNVLAEKSGIEDFLINGGVRFTLVTLIASLIYWFLIFVTVIAVLDMLGSNEAIGLFSEVISFLPHVIIAVVVIIFGSLISKFVHAVVYTYLDNIGIESARVISAVAQYAILVMVVFVALEHLSISRELLISAFQLAFGALCLAAAIAFGLGGKELAAKLLEIFWKRK
jgi:hypothetical protein